MGRIRVSPCFFASHFQVLDFISSLISCCSTFLYLSAPRSISFSPTSFSLFRSLSHNFPLCVRPYCLFFSACLPLSPPSVVWDSFRDHFLSIFSLPRCFSLSFFSAFSFKNSIIAPFCLSFFLCSFLIFLGFATYFLCTSIHPFLLFLPHFLPFFLSSQPRFSFPSLYFFYTPAHFRCFSVLFNAPAPPSFLVFTPLTAPPPCFSV